jgi:phytoene synthase
MCVQIFGCQDQGAKQYAIDLGVALQLTNILRDVPGDLGRGRVYLPLDDLQRFGVSEAELGTEVARAGHGVVSARVKALLAFEASRARAYYARADAALPRADARRLVAARIMGRIYRGILDRIERAGYDVFSAVIRVPRPRRALIAAGTWARTLVTGR